MSRILLLLLALTGPFFLLLGERDLRFVYDDVRFVEENEAVHDLNGVVKYFTDPRVVDPSSWGGIWRPLRTLDFAVDWKIAGLFESPAARARWFHLKSVLYHLLAVALVFLLLRSWTGDRLVSFLGALVFWYHPVQVESVAWITSRGDLLCAVFFLAALFLHGRVRKLGGKAVAVGGLLALALLSKEAAVVFPAAAFLADYFFRDHRRLRTTLRRWPVYLLYAVICVGYAGVWVSLHHAHGGEVWHLPQRWGGSLLGSLLTFSRGALYYLRILILPVDLAQDFYLAEVRSPDLVSVLLLAGLVVLIVGAVLRSRRIGSIWPFAVLWAVLTIFPSSSIAVPLGIPTAERFLYLPLVGIVLLAGMFLARAWRSGRAGRILVPLLILCLFAVSAKRSRIWASEEALWETTFARVRSPRAMEWMALRLMLEGESLNLRASDLMDQGEMDGSRQNREEARSRFTRSLGIYDQALSIWRLMTAGPIIVQQIRSHRALCLHSMGRSEEALAELDAVMGEPPFLVKVHFPRALALVGVGRLREAAREIDLALEQRSTRERRKTGAGIYQQLAKQYNREGNRARTFVCLNRSWQLLPDGVVNGGVYAALKQLKEEYLRLSEPLHDAVRRDPTDGDSWLQLACAYAGYGFYREAAGIFDRLLSEETVDRGGEILYPYAYYFWQWRDTPEGYRRAKEIYEEILEKFPTFEEVEGQLALCRERLAREKEQR